MSRRGNQHAGWRHLHGVRSGWGSLTQRTARSLYHPIVLNFIKSLTQVTEAVALGRQNPDPALYYSLLPGVRWCPGVSHGGPQPTISVRPPPVPSSELHLDGLVPGGLKKGKCPPACGSRKPRRAVPCSWLPGTNGPSTGEPPRLPDSPSLLRVPNLPRPL